MHSYLQRRTVAAVMLETGRIVSQELKKGGYRKVIWNSSMRNFRVASLNAVSGDVYVHSSLAIWYHMISPGPPFTNMV